MTEDDIRARLLHLADSRLADNGEALKALRRDFSERGKPLGVASRELHHGMHLLALTTPSPAGFGARFDIPNDAGIDQQLIAMIDRWAELYVELGLPRPLAKIVLSTPKKSTKIQKGEVDLAAPEASEQSDKTKPEPDWKMRVQAAATVEAIKLLANGSQPSRSGTMAERMSQWCRTNNVKTKTGVIPSPGYLRIHVLKYWTMPTMSREAAVKYCKQIEQAEQVEQARAEHAEQVPPKK